MSHKRVRTEVAGSLPASGDEGSRIDPSLGVVRQAGDIVVDPRSQAGRRSWLADLTLPPVMFAALVGTVVAVAVRVIEERIFML